MRIDVVTIFPAHARGSARRRHRAPRRGQGDRVASASTTCAHWSDDKHRSVDDAPFGGGPGMVMKAEPFFRRSRRSCPAAPGQGDAVVLLSPRGRRFEPGGGAALRRPDRLVLLCGRYEGIDERVREGLATEEVSLGDFVLTGGEVAALAVIEATVRLLPGALGDEDSAAAGLLRAAAPRLPPLHAAGRRTAAARSPRCCSRETTTRSRRWRRKEALRATRERRPDLLAKARLTVAGRGASARDRGRGARSLNQNLR